MKAFKLKMNEIIIIFKLFLIKIIIIKLIIKILMMIMFRELIGAIIINKNIYGYRYSLNKNK